MENKFYIGQRVRYIGEEDDALIGKIGVIVGGREEILTVEFDAEFEGHSGEIDRSLLRHPGHCWNVTYDEVEPLTPRENAFYALGVREGVPFNIEDCDGGELEDGPYELIDGDVVDCVGDALSMYELGCLFDGGPMPLGSDEEDEIVAKIRQLSAEIDALRDELNRLMVEAVG